VRIKSPTPFFLQSIAEKYNPDWEPISRVEAEDLFRKEAIMFGNSDGVPVSKACRLFGYIPVARIWQGNLASLERKDCYVNQYSIDKKHVSYITWSGFKECVTTCNIEICAADEQAFSEILEHSETEEHARDAKKKKSSAEVSERLKE